MHSPIFYRYQQVSSPDEVDNLSTADHHDQCRMEVVMYRALTSGQNLSTVILVAADL